MSGNAYQTVWNSSFWHLIMFANESKRKGSTGWFTNERRWLIQLLRGLQSCKSKFRIEWMLISFPHLFYKGWEQCIHLCSIYILQNQVFLELQALFVLAFQWSDTGSLTTQSCAAVYLHLFFMWTVHAVKRISLGWGVGKSWKCDVIPSTVWIYASESAGYLIGQCDSGPNTMPYKIYSAWICVHEVNGLIIWETQTWKKCWAFSATLHS